MWKQLCNAFDVDRLVMIPRLLPARTSVDQYDTLNEALQSCDGSIVALEPSGGAMLSDFEHPQKAVYVFGNAQTSNKHLDCEQVRINTPTMTDIFAVNAAAIVLADRL